MWSALELQTRARMTSQVTEGLPHEKQEAEHRPPASATLSWPHHPLLLGSCSGPKADLFSGSPKSGFQSTRTFISQNTKAFEEFEENYNFFKALNFAQKRRKAQLKDFCCDSLETVPGLQGQRFHTLSSEAWLQLRSPEDFMSTFGIRGGCVTFQDFCGEGHRRWPMSPALLGTLSGP